LGPHDAPLALTLTGLWFASGPLRQFLNEKETVSNRNRQGCFPDCYSAAGLLGINMSSVGHDDAAMGVSVGVLVMCRALFLWLATLCRIVARDTGTFFQGPNTREALCPRGEPLYPVETIRSSSTITEP